MVIISTLSHKRSVRSSQETLKDLPRVVIAKIVSQKSTKYLLDLSNTANIVGA